MRMPTAVIDGDRDDRPNRLLDSLGGECPEDDQGHQLDHSEDWKVRLIMWMNEERPSLMACM